MVSAISANKGVRLYHDKHVGWLTRSVRRRFNHLNSALSVSLQAEAACRAPGVPVAKINLAVYGATWRKGDDSWLSTVRWSRASGPAGIRSWPGGLRYRPEEVANDMRRNLATDLIAMSHRMPPVKSSPHSCIVDLAH
jgi:hypothetical protein